VSLKHAEQLRQVVGFEAEVRLVRGGSQGDVNPSWRALRGRIRGGIAVGRGAIFLDVPVSGPTKISEELGDSRESLCSREMLALKGKELFGILLV